MEENCRGHLADAFWMECGRQGCVSSAQSLGSAAPASEDTKSNTGSSFVTRAPLASHTT